MVACLLFALALGLLLYHLILPRPRPRFPNALHSERRGAKECQRVFCLLLATLPAAQVSANRSRLMIHRHSSVASRPRNARGMLGTVSSPIAQRARRREARRRGAARRRAGSETPKRCTITLPCRSAGHTALPPVCSAARRSSEQTECLLCVRV